MDSGNLTARLDQDTGSPLHIAASLRDVIYEGYTLNTVTLAADGTLSRHSVNAALRSADAEARLTLAAGYNAGIWKGKITMRGELRLPDVHIIGAQTSQVVAPSSDVVREGRVVPIAKASPLAMDVRVRVLLGDQVFVKVSGIDAQLGGAMDLSLSSLDRITSKGEIKVVKDQ